MHSHYKKNQQTAKLMESMTAKSSTSKKLRLKKAITLDLVPEIVPRLNIK